MTERVIDEADFARLPAEARRAAIEILVEVGQAKAADAADIPLHAAEVAAIAGADAVAAIEARLGAGHFAGIAAALIEARMTRRQLRALGTAGLLRIAEFGVRLRKRAEDDGRQR